MTLHASRVAITRGARLSGILRRQNTTKKLIDGKGLLMKNVVWVTNLAAPYRVPVWESFAQFCNLTVALLENNKLRISTGPRDVTWVGKDNLNYRTAGMRTIRLSKGERTLYLANPYNVARILRKKQAIVIGGWESPAYWQFLFLAKILRLTTVGFYESTNQSQRHTSGVINALRGYFYRAMDSVVVPGVAAATAVEKMGVAREDIYVGFNAVDVIRINTKVTEIRKDLRSLREGHRFLFIGQIIERKNIMSLLEAFESICEPKDSLTVIGAGIMQNQIADRAIQIGVSKQVRFKGKLRSDEIPGLLAEHHTLVLPSREEVWGLVVNEALAAGLHVVVSDRCGVADSVEHMNGVYVTGIDSDSIACGLVDSKEKWAGHIPNPEILLHTPERFAQVFQRAISSSTD